MQKIPLVRIKNKKSFPEISSSELRSILHRLQGSMIYVFDEDGIHKNHPNVSIYQRLSGVAELWVDAGPRNIGDIVDDVFSGANKLVIRPDRWREHDLQSIIDITENELMVLYHLKDLADGIPKDMLFSQAHCIIIHLDEKYHSINFKTEGFMKQIAKTKPTYILDETGQQTERWSSFGVTGIFIPLEQLEGGLS